MQFVPMTPEEMEHYKNSSLEESKSMRDTVLKWVRQVREREERKRNEREYQKMLDLIDE